MSLHRVYHPPNVFSTTDKQGLAQRITALYTAIGLPEFYVNVIFVPIEEDSLFVGGKAQKKYIRIVVQHLASQLHEKEIGRSIREKYEKAIAAYIKEKGYEWETHFEDISNEGWKLNGITPPLPNSSKEQEWATFRKIIHYN